MSAKLGQWNMLFRVEILQLEKVMNKNCRVQIFEGRADFLICKALYLLISGTMLKTSNFFFVSGWLIVPNVQKNKYSASIAKITT